MFIGRQIGVGGTGRVSEMPPPCDFEEIAAPTPVGAAAVDMKN
jgi:hypothetical protein